MALTVKVRQTLAGQNIENSFNFDGTGAVPGNADAIAQAIVNAWNLTLAPLKSADWSINSVVWRVRPALPGQPFITANVPALPIVGTNVEQGLPTTVSFTLALISEGGPPYRGHLALGGFTVEAIDSDREFSAGTVTAAEDFWNEMLTRLAAVDPTIDPVLVSTGSTQVVPGTDSRIDQVVGRSIPGSRYSRKKGVGS